MVRILSLSSMTSGDWSEIAAALERDRLVGLPTDTVYGIACKPRPDALARLFAVKGRESGKPVALVFDDVVRLVYTFARLPAPVLNAVEELLPGAVTVILPAPEHGLEAVAYEGGVGVRVVPLPAGSIFQRLPSPLALTSANLSGGADPCSVDEIPAVVANACDYIVDMGRIDGCGASTVLDLQPLAAGEPARILRQGSLGQADIEKIRHRL